VPESSGMDPESSSSSGPETSLRGLLQESLDCLEREIPQVYQRMCATLDGLSVRISLDDETVVIGFAGVHGRVDVVGRPVEAELCTSRRTVLAVLDGRLSLADAVLADAVRIKAPLDMLERLNGALEAYVHGAVRSHSFPALLVRFRAREQQESDVPAAAHAGRERVGL
jgi:hypothetical protein